MSRWTTILMSYTYLVQRMWYQMHSPKSLSQKVSTRLPELERTSPDANRFDLSRHSRARENHASKHIQGSKHNHAYLGPFIVVRRLPNGPYVLRDATGALFPRNVPVDQSKIIQHADAPIEGIQEVEAVSHHKKKGRKFFYLVN